MLAVVILIGGYVAVFRILQVDRRVTTSLVSRISGELNAAVDISSISVSPWNVGFHHVKVRFRAIPVVFEADAVRLGINPVHLIKNGFRPVNGIEELFLDSPKVTWTLSPSDTSSSSFSMKKIPEITVKNLPFLMVNIKNGSVLVSRNDTVLTVAERVNGILDGRSRGAATFRVEAGMLSGKKNARCSGRFERNMNGAAVDFTADGCDLSTRSLNVLTGSIQTKKGMLDLELHLLQKDGKVTCNGRYSVSKTELTIEGPGLNVRDIFMEGRVNEREILFDYAGGEVAGFLPRVKGSLVFFPTPILSVQGETEAGDLAVLFATVMPKMKEIPRGKVKLHALLGGPLDDLSLTAVMSSKAVSFRGADFSDADVSFLARKNEIAVDRLRFSANGFRVNARGTIRGDSRGRVRAFTLDSAVNGVTDRSLSFSLRLKGTADPRTSIYTADYEYARAQAEGDPFSRMQGTLTLSGDLVSFTGANPLVSCSGKAAHAFSHPEIDGRVTLMHFPVQRYLGLDSTSVMLNGSAEVSGTKEACAFSGDFTLEAGTFFRTAVSGKGTCVNPLARTRSITVDASLAEFRALKSAPVTLSASVRSDSASTEALVRNPEHTMELSVRAEAVSRALSGHLKLAGFPLEFIIGLFADPTGYSGKLTGDAEFGGTLDHPNFQTPLPLVAEELTLGKIGRWSGTSKISGNLDELLFSEVEFKRDRTVLAHGEGVWTRGRPFILSAEGNGVDFGALGDIISSQRACGGRADYSITMGFTGSEGTIEGSVKIRNGHFLDIPFDEMSATLSGGSDGFRATDFHIVSKGVFTGEGSASSGYFWKNANPNNDLKIDLNLQGDLPRVLPYLTPAVRKASGECTLAVTVGGTWQEPAIVDGRLTLTKGVVEPSFFIDQVSDINVAASIEPEANAPPGMKAVRILSASGTVKGRKLIVENTFLGEKLWETIKRPELTHIVNSAVGLDFGVFTGKIEKGGSRDRSIELHIPGFMKSRDTGRFELADEGRGGFVVGAAESEDRLTPFISARIKVLSGDITYPPVVGEEGPTPAKDANAVNDIFWDMEISAGSNVYYVNDITKTISETEYRVPLFNIRLPLAGATIARTYARLDEKSSFRVTGRISDGSFHVTGAARSSAGTVTYVGVEFQIDSAELDLDTARTEKPAQLTARAETTAIDDSSGVQTVIYLKVNAVDKATGKRIESFGHADVPNETYTELPSELSMVINAGGLGYLEIEFSSSNPADTTRDRILARLGISSGRFGSVASRALASGVDTYYLGLMRPLEQAIRKRTGLDVVRFTPSVIGNLVRSRLVFLDRFGPDTNYELFDGSSIMLGKYLRDNFFFSYQVQYGLARDFLRRKERGFYHEAGLQYTIKKTTRLQLNYTYDEVIKQNDKRTLIRHDFDF
jgi:hypothetical protein